MENIFKPDYREFPLFSVNWALVEIKPMQNKSFGKNILQGIRLRMGKIFHNPYRQVNIGPVKKIFLKHLNPGKIRTHRLFGKTIYYYSPTELLHGLHEIFVENIYKQHLPSRPYIIDCGANIGLSVIYMKRLYPQARIIAFEPDERNFSLLEKNICAFGFEQVETRREAVWIENTELQFASEGSMSSRIDMNAADDTITVKAVRLRDFLDRPVDFLKIDIEGAEYKVMNDIAGQLHFVDHLFLEYHGSFTQNAELAQLLTLLVEKGFSYYIKEATSVYDSPLELEKRPGIPYDVQLNIFCFRETKPMENT
jgi:FkbM family methyltransferase